MHLGLMKNFLTLLLISVALGTQAQGNPEDYYYEIPEYPETYTPGAVAARLVDGLGFRYYWATEGLRSEDLEYRPSAEARNVIETIDHIQGLTAILYTVTIKQEYKSQDLDGFSFEEKRNITLENIRMASENLKKGNINLDEMDMTFQSSGSSFPFWNLINGPIADAINHVGQIITLRRTNGNPIHNKISVLRGTVFE